MVGPVDLLDRVLLGLPEPTETIASVPVSNWGEVFEMFANRHRSSWKVHALIERWPDGSRKIVASTFLGYLLVYKWGRKLMVGS